jgi:hypothetical protein
MARSVSIKATTIKWYPKNVTFTACNVTAESVDRYYLVKFRLKRSDTKEEKCFELTIDNSEGVLNSLALVPLKSVLDMWECPFISFKDPHKKGGKLMSSCINVG